MKKVLAMVLVGMMLLVSVSAMAWTASITTDDLTTVETEASVEGLCIVVSNEEIEAETLEAINNEIKAIEGVDAEMNLDELLPIGVLNYVEGATATAKFETITPYEDGQEITVVVGEQGDWTVVEATVENGKVVVPFDAELLKQVADAEAAYCAILSK